MPMPAAELKQLIRDAFPDAEIELRSLAADDDHYSVAIVSERFRGRNRVQQHQMVYEALKGGWATNCTRWPCRPPCRNRARRTGVDHGDDRTGACRDPEDCRRKRRRALHEGNGRFSAMRVFQPDRIDSSLPGGGFPGCECPGERRIAAGIKDFTNWPTVPQLYIKGEFVGGCDIITEMTMSGEIDTMLTDKGVTFDPAAAEKIRQSNAA